MKLAEITRRGDHNQMMNESITFMPVSRQPHKDGGTILTPHNHRKGHKPCFSCDSKPNNWEDGDCGVCDGKGKIQTHIHDGPELHVSNANARVIADLIGMHSDDSGHVSHADLPHVIRRLISITNKDGSLDQYTQDPYDNKNDRTMAHSRGDDGMSHIGKGAQMIDYGRSSKQVEHYASEMLKIVKYAMDHKLDISWA